MTKEQKPLSEPHEFELKKSFVGFIDILGFSNLFPRNTQMCLKLLSEFTSHSGEHFDKLLDAGERQTRAAAVCFSDNIVTSIPTITNHDKPDLFYRPLITFLHALSFFSYRALLNGMYMRGAIAFGDMYQTESVVAGEPLIEAARYEKLAQYPRIILTPSFKQELDLFIKGSPYGWSQKDIYANCHFEQDEVDGTHYFNWLGFHKSNPISNRSNTKQSEIIQTEIMCEASLRKKIEEEKDLAILQKLYWMKHFFEKSISKEI
ncbi:hypothetical protein SCO11_09325 [Legionella pneumophila serogroup 1]|uniref:hypothetical protein n=1 Tax=Legionella pneumophila TaxID=446 RepID=UPI000770878F|nr:hypothetical protein [Legionella pneumophila]MCZ4749686.1 hypothetical protein [Legionella pneumophila]CZO93788.1 Uncharacterised protein [Legionella pneumophila]CZP74051.1 Uncharacterised protein [Legionella pneumophila]HAT6348757.1 hypothetical protein [Legionella pneumophila]HAT7968994.1 hypothetical protein [Legionella pneumophila]